WLGLVGSDLCGKPRRGESACAGKTGAFLDRSKKFVRRGQGRTMQALCSSKIEISLVDGNHFDDRRKFHKNRGDAVAPFAVLFVMAVEKDRVGTQPARRSQGHCRMNTVFSRFI